MSLARAALVVLSFQLAAAFTHRVVVSHHASVSDSEQGEASQQETGMMDEEDVGRRELPDSSGGSGLTFFHVAYNFGHTVEAVSLRDSNGALQWGGNYPGMREISNITGCPMYFTPMRLWPQSLKDEYVGSNQIWGIFRDPYERLVAEFRGGFQYYGAFYDPALLDNCSTDLAVKQMLHNYLAGSNPYDSGCALLPQVEFTKGTPYVTIPVDNRLFPHSANSIMAEYGFPYHIQQSDILHVQHCFDSHTGELQPDTKALIRQVYAEDFEFLCASFGYCDNTEDTCLRYVNGMCPTSLYTWNEQLEMYEPKTPES
eukprot:CAMPEP_0178418130 /NCGR_PEP_ID=MMETSP0689_2-20121128/24930_1 /TAXON_ID=160604 /ORGANISM="Amphidinium massartii, Strain CS-259" /LENGTH=313 /DNA_ID=CAMNT_0020039515 /DNA_START=82 /DNA_END=1023 /DNA_ORIENTATION=-